MSETTNSFGATERGDEGTRSAQAAGAMLRKAREDAGLHVAALAMALKVPVKKLEALEAGRIDLLPDATFARGLAASICRGLKLDPKPVLDLMPGIGGSRLGAAPPAINERFEPSAPSSSGTSLRALSNPALLAVMLLLLGALAMYFYPRGPDTGAESVEAGSGSPSTVEMTVPSGAMVPSVPPESSPPAAVPAVPAVALPQAAPEPAASAADAGDALVVFTAKTESWVQVVDAKGVAVLRRTLQAGERVTATGALPLAVVVGRMDAVDVQVRGQPMNLGAVAKNNIARFEVK